MNLNFFGVLQNADLLLWGTWYTVFTAILAIILGLILGTILFLGMQSGSRIIRGLVAVSGSFVRGTPALVQIFVFYYALAPLTGLDIGPVTAGIMAIGFNSAAYIAQILKSGFSRITRGQIEAASALGMSTFETWRKVILPQVFYAVFPPLANEFTMVIKVTPLLSVITVVELTRASQVIIADTFRPVEVLLVAAAIYFVICFVLTQLVEMMQRRTAVFRM